MSNQPSALVTNVTHFAGPPAVDALVDAGFRVFCHDPGFGEPGARHDYGAGRPHVRTLVASDPSAIVAESVGAGKDRIIVLAIDNAGWHRANKLEVPSGIHIEYLPPYTPELQPAERLWPLANEAVANGSLHSIEDLDHANGKRCLQLSDQPHTIRDYTNFQWWPQNLS